MGRSIYIVGSGTLKREQNTIALRRQGKEPRYFPIEGTEDIYVFGEISINTALLKLLMKKGVPLHLFDRYGSYIGSFLPLKPHTSAITYIRQFEHFQGPQKRLSIARSLQTASVRSMRNYLKRQVRNGRVNIGSVENIERYLQDMERETTLEGLRSYEGLARKIYFSEFANLTGDYPFSGRIMRPPGDPINALLSYGYGVLYGKVLSAIFETYLDPRISFVHEPTFKGYALHLDIADLFKVAVVDSLVLSMAGRHQIKENWFHSENGGTYLSGEGKRTFISTLEEKFEKRYKSLIKQNVRALQHHIDDGKEWHPFVWKG